MATTAPRPATRRAADDISYTDLYERWERGNWSATEIDFSQDKIDWEEKMTDAQRRTAMWLFSLFFHGEDAVTDGLSPYIDAAPLEEQKYFIATQQVDEARHSVFFNRFMNEVVGLGDGSIAGGMNATAGELSWPAVAFIPPAMLPSPTPTTSFMKRLKKTLWRASSTCCVAMKYFCSSSGAASM